MRRIVCSSHLSRASLGRDTATGNVLRRVSKPGTSGRMTLPNTRSLALLSAIAAGFALGLALASEKYGGLVPCELCLLERWPYRVAIVCALVTLVVPPRFARPLLMLVVLSM